MLGLFTVFISSVLVSLSVGSSPYDPLRLRGVGSDSDPVADVIISQSISVDGLQTSIAATLGGAQPTAISPPPVTSSSIPTIPSLSSVLISEPSVPIIPSVIVSTIQTNATGPNSSPSNSTSPLAAPSITTTQSASPLGSASTSASASSLHSFGTRVSVPTIKVMAFMILAYLMKDAVALMGS